MSTYPTVVQRAGRLDIEIEQYSGLRIPILVKDKVSQLPIDLTGYEFKMEVRANHRSETVVLTLEGSTGNGKIDEIDLPAGRFDMVFTAADTATLDEDGYVYDLLGVPPSSQPERLIRGEIIPIPGSTVYP